MMWYSILVLHFQYSSEEMRNAEEAAAAEAESLPDLIAEESSAQAGVGNTAHVVRGFPPEIIITLVVKQIFFF